MGEDREPDSGNPGPGVRLLDLLLPYGCVACGGVCRRGSGRWGLCPDCVRRLQRPADPACTTCGRPLPAGAARGRCAACLRRPPPWRELTAGWLYLPPFDHVLHAIKYARYEYLVQDLGTALALDLGPSLPAGAPVVPVPLHWSRRWRRGFDQARSLAAAFARAGGFELVPALVRRRPTRPQVRRSRGRRLHHLDGAFACRTPEAVAGQRILLVDDVVTTGATARAAARTLLAAGAASVHVLAAARTPAPGERVPDPAGKGRPGRRIDGRTVNSLY